MTPSVCEPEALRLFSFPALPPATGIQFRFRYAPSKLNQTRAFLALLEQDTNRLAHVQYIPRSVVRFALRALRDARKCGGFVRRKRLAKLYQTEYQLF